MGGNEEINGSSGGGGGGDGVRKIMSACDVEALKKCLEENKGDQTKCRSQIEAFKTACAVKKPTSS